MKEQLIEVRNLSYGDRRGKKILNSVTFGLSRNEIFGIAGVAGNGQTELARIVAGLDSTFEGSVRPFSNDKLSISYIPDDRIQVATAAKLNVQENLTLRDFTVIPCASRGLLKPKELARVAQDRVTRFGIKVPTLTSPLSVLSGGNIQRVVVARELANKVDLVIAHNPTAGLDLSTCHFVQEALVAAAERGACILLISDDLDELVALSDRVLVLHNGSVGGTLKGTEISAMKIAGLMAGGESDLPVNARRNSRTTDAQPNENG